MKYVIFCKEGKRGYCLGVNSANRGTAVVLLHAGRGGNMEWEMNPASKQITLAGHPELALAYGGDKITDKIEVILRESNPGEVSQQWNWTTKAPAIINPGSDYALDNKDNKLRGDNPIILRPYDSKSVSQRWELMDFPTFERLVLHEDESVPAK